jgi:hypothetical protein
VDEGIASELQKALDTAAEQEAKARRFVLAQSPNREQAALFFYNCLYDGC